MQVFFVVFALAVLLQRLLELRISKRNAAIILAAGGREFGAAHYPIIVIIHLAWYVTWLVESVSIGPHLNTVWPLWMVLFLLAEGLRYWVISSLGPYWSMRIYAIPGRAWIRQGPYRYLAHPNYLVVTIELFVIPMIFDAWHTALIFPLLYVFALFAFRIPAEKKATKLTR